MGTVKERRASCRSQVNKHYFLKKFKKFGSMA